MIINMDNLRLFHRSFFEKNQSHWCKMKTIEYSNRVIFLILFRSFVTGPTSPNDEIPNMIGRLYIDLKNKSKMELEAGLDEIHRRQQQEDLKGEHVLIIFIILKIDIQLVVCTELEEQPR